MRTRFPGLSFGGGLGLELEVDEEVDVVRGSGVLGTVWLYPGGDWEKPGGWWQFSLRAATAGTQARWGLGGMLCTMD